MFIKYSCVDFTMKSPMIFVCFLVYPHLSNGLHHVVVTPDRTSAVLDSSILFHGNITQQSDSESSHSHDRFRWTWHSSADNETKQVYSNDTSYIITKVFSSPSVVPDSYNMTVNVFNNSASYKLASGSRSFQLTEELNGDLHLQQPNLHQRKAFYYSTKKPIFVHAIVHDTFSQYSEFIYSWLLNTEKPINISSDPNFTYVFNETKDVFIGANVTALLYDKKGHPPIKEKHGESDFRRFLTIIDSIEYLEVLAQDTISVNSTLNLTIICTGSKTFTVVISITSPSSVVENMTLPNIETCLVNKFYILSELGQYYIGVSVENDVSIAGKTISVQTQYEEPVTAFNVMIPIFCAMVFIVVLSLVFYTYYKDRQHVNIETANFDFRFWRASRRRSESFSQQLQNITNYCKNAFNGLSKQNSSKGAQSEVLLQNVELKRNYQTTTSMSFTAIDT